MINSVTEEKNLPLSSVQRLIVEVLFPEIDGKLYKKGGETNTMLINKKLTTAIATGAIIFSAVTPALASTGVGVIGNGAESNNTVSVTQTNTTTASQNNDANITNNIKTQSSTGGNNADFNTGGNTSVQTGAATNGVSVSNTANINALTVGDPCNCDNGATILEDGNGAFSNSTADLSNTNTKTATQNNTANFTNNVDSSASTGKNSASDNTGGDNTIMTGAAKNWTDVVSTANKNVMGGTGATAGTGATTLTIGDNGALSTSAITDTNNTTAVAAQNNAATFFNNVDSSAKTGKNAEDFNTDGNNQIQTGPAANWTGVANIANNNAMDALGCGCATGDVFKVGDNGAFSGSAINATNTNTQTAAQDNGATFSNYVDPQAFSGDNSLSDATGSYWFGGDNSVMTGQSASQTEVVNTSNTNEISSNGINIGGIDWGFNFNPGSLLGM